MGGWVGAWGSLVVLLGVGVVVLALVVVVNTGCWLVLSAADWLL